MYGSYSSLSYDLTMSSPMDIRPRGLSSQAQDASCAFPAWPRRSSLCSSEREQRATSFLSDEDLELQYPCDDDASSISSSGSSSNSSPQHMYPTEAELLELERKHEAYRREVARCLIAEKMRRQAMRKQPRRLSIPTSSASARKGSKSSGSKSGAAMTPIAEMGE